MSMEDVTITIDFRISLSDKNMARQLIAASLDELISEAIAGGAIDPGTDSEIFSYQVITDT